MLVCKCKEDGEGHVNMKVLGPKLEAPHRCRGPRALHVASLGVERKEISG
jgi:hypothetical protein